MEWIAITRPKSMSAVLDCPFDAYTIIDTTVVTFYFGLHQALPDKIENRTEALQQVFQGRLENDWDAHTQSSRNARVYNSSTKGFIIKGDSVFESTPRLPAAYYYPCYQCE